MNNTITCNLSSDQIALYNKQNNPYTDCVDPECRWKDHQKPNQPIKPLFYATHQSASRHNYDLIKGDIFSLPFQVFVHIFSFLNLQDFHQCLLVNKEFNNISSHKYVWKDFLTRILPSECIPVEDNNKISFLKELTPDNVYKKFVRQNVKTDCKSACLSLRCLRGVCFEDPSFLGEKLKRITGEIYIRFSCHPAWNISVKFDTGSLSKKESPRNFREVIIFTKKLPIDHDTKSVDVLVIKKPGWINSNVTTSEGGSQEVVLGIMNEVREIYYAWKDFIEKRAEQNRQVN